MPETHLGQLNHHFWMWHVVSVFFKAAQMIPMCSQGEDGCPGASGWAGLEGSCPPIYTAPTKGQGIIGRIGEVFPPNENRV